MRSKNVALNKCIANTKSIVNILCLIRSLWRKFRFRGHSTFSSSKVHQCRAFSLLRGGYRWLLPCAKTSMKASTFLQPIGIWVREIRKVSLNKLRLYFWCNEISVEVCKAKYWQRQRMCLVRLLFARFCLEINRLFPDFTPPI